MIRRPPKSPPFPTPPLFRPPRRDEDHVGALEHLFDLLAVVLGGLPADVGLRPGAQSAGEFTADVELDVRVAHQQRLGVGVDGDEDRKSTRLNSSHANISYAV